MQTISEMRSFLGKLVKIRLTSAGSYNNGPLWITGTLISIEDSAEVITMSEDGFVKYSWPCLEIRDADG